MKKINLLYIITGLGVGGAERVVLDLATYGNKEQYNIKVISLSKRKEMLEIFKEQGVDVVSLCKGNDFISFMQIVKFLNHFVRENKIDIIHAHMTHALIVSSMVKVSNPNLKIIFTSHSINLESKIRELLIFVLKLFRSVDILFSKEQLKFFYKKECQYIPNGIHIQDYELQIKKNDKFTFISVGRLEEEKNHKALINSVRSIKAKYDFEVWIVGNGYLREELIQLVKKYKLGNYVKFLGLRKDIPVLLNQAHCFVLPSLWEGLPMALLEAASAKLPIISTPVGSIPSLLNNDNAYLTDIEHLSKKMSEVMDNYEIALLKAQKLKEKIIENYSLESVVEKHEEIYKNLCSDV